MTASAFRFTAIIMIVSAIAFTIFRFADNNRVYKDTASVIEELNGQQQPSQLTDFSNDQAHLQQQIAVPEADVLTDKLAAYKAEKSAGQQQLQRMRQQLAQLVTGDYAEQQDVSKQTKHSRINRLSGRIEAMRQQQQAHQQTASFNE